MDNRGIDTDPGWINRKFQDLSRQIEGLRSERRAAATTITNGDLTIANGGSVTAEGGGVVRAAFINRVIQLRASDLEASVIFNGEHPDQSMSMNIDGAFGENGTVLRCSGDLSLLPVTNAVKINHATTSASANAVLDATTKILTRSTSSRRYKQDIEDIAIDPALVLKMRARTWRDRNRMKDDPECERRYVGFIAEELHDLGLTEFVEYDPEGRPDAIAYDRLCVALLALAQDERARVDALTEQVAALADAIAALTPDASTPAVRSSKR